MPRTDTVRVRNHVANNTPDQSAFAGSVRANKSEALAVVEIETHSLICDQVSKCFTRSPTRKGKRGE